MNRILETLLLISLSSGVIYGAVMAFRTALRRSAPPAVLIALWIVFMARLAVPLTVEVPFHFFAAVQPESSAAAVLTAADGYSGPLQNIPDVRQQAAGAQTAARRSETDAPTRQMRQQSSQPAAPAVSWKPAFWILTGLTAGTAWMILRALRRLMCMQRCIRCGSSEPARQLEQAFECEKRRLGIRAAIPLRLVEGLETPALAFVPAPAVLLPAGMSTHPHVAMALRHELLHFCRRDYLLVLAAECVRLFWWFNPFAHLALRAMREDIEAACDAEVVRGCSAEAKAVYAGMLIALSRAKRQECSALSMSPASPVENRIRSLFRPEGVGRGARAGAAVLAGILALTCFTTACQPTPQSAAVSQKDKTQIEEQLSRQAADKPAAPPAVWVDEKTYPTGQLLEINVMPVDFGGSEVPVAEITHVPFTEESARVITGALLPGARVTEAARTKQQLAAEIEALEELLVQAEADPGSVSSSQIPLAGNNMPQTAAEWDEYASMSPAEQIRMALEGYQTAYEEAPDASDLHETDYVFTDRSGSTQLNIMDADGTELSFVNWEDTGSSEFSYRVTALPPTPNHTRFRNLAPEKVPLDNGYETARRTAEDFAARLTDTPMKLQDVTCEELRGESSLQYTFVFVPVISGYPQTYPADYVGKQSYADGETAQAHAEPECLTVCVADDRVFRAQWCSPSSYTVVNSSTAVLSFDEAREIALRQFDRLLVPEAQNVLTMKGNDVLTLTDARLGLAKMLIPGEEAYRLVPCWTFSGNQTLDGEWGSANSSTVFGETVAFVTVNATDGSIVDRGTMS